MKDQLSARCAELTAKALLPGACLERAEHEELHQAQKAIYGFDDRIEAREAPEEVQPYIRSVFAIVRRTRLRPLDQNESRLRTIPFTTASGRRLCSGERFYGQPCAAECTAFLVGPQTVVTAGHCLRPDSLAEFVLVRGWAFAASTAEPLSALRAEDVYRPVELLAHRSALDDDYAVVRLDREVRDAVPFEVASPGDNPLYILGHPAGLPLKYANNGPIVAVTARTVSAVVDSFAGNSGSPMVDTVSHKAVGVLIRGARDYAAVEVPGGGQCIKSITAEGGELGYRLDVLAGDLEVSDPAQWETITVSVPVFTDGEADAEQAAPSVWVRKLQGLLRVHYPDLVQDGILGIETRHVIREYQSSVGLERTGDADARTWASLLG